MKRGRTPGPSVAAAEAEATYRKDMPSYAGSAMFFRALEMRGFRADGPDCGWSRYVNGRLETFDALGNHSTMLRSPNVRQLANPIRAALDRVVSHAPARERPWATASGLMK